MADALNARWITLLCRRVSPGFSLAGRPTSSQMNYFYYYALAGANGGSVQRVLRKPPCPLLFLHGCGSFHDEAWAEGLNRRPLCEARFICRDHWFFQAEPRRSREALCAWLQATQ